MTATIIATLTDTTLAGSSLLQWLLAATVTMTVLAVVGLLRRVHGRRSAAGAASGGLRAIAHDLLRGTSMLLVLVLAVCLGAQLLELTPRLATVLARAATVAVLLQAALWVNCIFGHVLADSVARRLDHDAAGATTLTVVGFIGRLVLWSVAALLILENLGLDVTGLIAGLGIGGIAVALAAQNVLGDLFASLSIALDKPFLIGDFIIVGEQMGTVEHIGIKTTRIRSLNGEQIVFANTDLLDNAIHNYKRMYERRVVFTFGVTYETDADALAALPAMVRDIVAAQAQTRFDRAHFKEFGDYALIYEVVYYVLAPEYNLYMDIQQAINLALLRRCAARGIDFAYPTQRLQVTAAPPGLAA